MDRFLDELGGELLASVSRSFYLTIRFLPAAMRAPVTLAYLLARTSDTIADESAAPVPLRLKHLRAFRDGLDAIQSGATPDAGSLREDIVPADPGERHLIAKAGRCLEWLAATAPADREEIVSVLRKIIHGQALDLERFGEPARLQALRTGDELDEYTYLVAGCVGEFWTRLCFMHLPGYSRLARDDMDGLGRNFGKGLQLVNILRDLPADLKAGRCYLPADELAALGRAPDSLLDAPREARPVFSRWLLIARGHLGEGAHYIENAANARIRFACFLPWYLGMRTLALISAQPPLETGRRLKVCRSEVYGVMALAVCAAFSNGTLRAVRRRLEAAFEGEP